MIYHGGEISGVAKSLMAMDVARELLDDGNFKQTYLQASGEDDTAKLRDIGLSLFRQIKDKENVPLIISDDPKWSVKNANILFTATNDPAVLIFKADIAATDKDIYIIDTSTPHNVDKSVNELPHVHRRGGGLVTSVSKQPLIFQGTDLEETDLFACIAETLLISADEEAKPTAGAISVADLEAMARAGERFGFVLSENEGKSEIFTSI